MRSNGLLGPDLELGASRFLLPTGIEQRAWSTSWLRYEPKYLQPSEGPVLNGLQVKSLLKACQTGNHAAHLGSLALCRFLVEEHGFEVSALHAASTCCDAGFFPKGDNLVKSGLQVELTGVLGTISALIHCEGCCDQPESAIHWVVVPQKGHCVAGRFSCYCPDFVIVFSCGDAEVTVL